MKKTEITTGKATIVVVDMPEGAIKINVVEGCYGNEYKDKIVYNLKEYTENQILNHIEQIDLPQGHWKLLRQFSQLTEDQWRDIVDLHYSQLGFEDYDSDCEFNVLNTATESGLSLLRANGILLENPVTVDLTGNNELNCDYAEWQSFESQLWKNPYIFIKVK
ncbi:hypothetical protein ACR79B_20630 [Sphingobacterium spiritivorum]|uniref:hypothetical protein n=1 Tax=Sphingobacterium spiritivorum TaxID=258 RepID=UPI003DA5BB10